MGEPDVLAAFGLLQAGPSAILRAEGTGATRRLGATAGGSAPAPAHVDPPDP